MLLLARLAALSVITAVLALLVLPSLLGSPPEESSDGTSPDVKIAKNTRWGDAGRSTDQTMPGGATPPGERPHASQSTKRPGEQSPGVSAGGPQTTSASGQAAGPDGDGASLPTQRKRFYRVIVQNAGTLKTGNRIIRLKGIAVRDQDETCKDSSGESWPCGVRARAALTRLIRGRAVICEVPQSAEAEITGRCNVAGTDLSRWMVRHGWAKPAMDSDNLAEAQDKAKQDRIGLWGSASQPIPEPVPNELESILGQGQSDEETDRIYDQ